VFQGADSGIKSAARVRRVDIIASFAAGRLAHDPEKWEPVGRKDHGRDNPMYRGPVQSNGIAT
jgi:hypothetical protein